MPKIAICDDEQPIREYLKSLTEKCIPDSQVRLFGSGEALLRDQTSFDVILLDVSLRGEDGNQTLNGMERFFSFAPGISGKSAGSVQV